MKNFMAEWILDSVQGWIAGAYWMIRETGLVNTNLRVDALLVPVNADAHCMKELTQENFWSRPRLVGIEVKASRNDFLRGVREGQFEKYDSLLSGMYIAVLRGVAKPSEVPKKFGFLTITKNQSGRRNWSCVCQRQPTYTEPPVSAETVWKLLFTLRDEYIARVRELEKKHKGIEKRIGRLLEYKMHDLVYNILRQAEADYKLSKLKLDQFMEGAENEQRDT